MTNFFSKLNIFKLRVFGLLLLLTAIGFFIGSRFLLVKAESDQVNLFPENVHPVNESSLWRETANALDQGLSPQAKFSEFSGSNSANIFFQGSQAAEPVPADGQEILKTAPDPAKGSGGQDPSEPVIEKEKADAGLDNDIETAAPAESVPADSEAAAPESIRTLDAQPDASPDPANTPASPADTYSASPASPYILPEGGIYHPQPVVPETGDTSLFRSHDLSSDIFDSTRGYLASIGHQLASINIALAENGLIASNTEPVQDALVFDNFNINAAPEEEIANVQLRLSLAGKSSRPNDSIKIEYGLGQEWEEVGEIGLAQTASNDNNGGYYLFSLPIFQSWEDINKLQIRVTYRGGAWDEQSSLQVYLDALWLEVNYNKKSPSEEQDPADQEDEGESVKVREEDNYEVELLSDKKDFSVKELPKLKFNFNKKRGMLGRIGAGLLSLVYDEYSDLQIQASLEGTQFRPLVKYLGRGDFVLDFPEMPRNFKPGKQRIVLSINKPGLAIKEPLNYYRDFTWGVLAFNLNKSYYLPAETAHLAFGVVDDEGHTICDADLKAEITAPDGGVAELSTDNGLVIRNPECGPDNIIKDPDYYADYGLAGTGVYRISVTARTVNGIREYQDQFEVKEYLPFEAERIGPSRIYPKADYEMRIRFRANEDYQGPMTEKVPNNFVIKNQKVIIQRADPDVEAENTYDYADAGWPFSLSRGSNETSLIWAETDIKNGDEVEISYTFDAPDDAPEFYLLGPLQMDIFQEGRKWQIAADAVNNRANSITLLAGTYSGTGAAGQNTNTNQQFNNFTFSLGEASTTIKNAYIVFESHFEAYANLNLNYNGITLAFDACQEPCAPDAFTGSGVATVNNATILAYNESDSNQVRVLADVTRETQLAAYTGSSTLMRGRVGYNISYAGGAVNAIADARALLVVTYEYDPSIANNLTKTVYYPLESQVMGDTGSRQASQSNTCTLNTNCPRFDYQMQLPDYPANSSSTVSQWFTTYNANDANASNDVAVDVNIQGYDVNSTQFIHEASTRGNDQAFMPAVFFSGVSGYSQNRSQILEYRATAGAGTWYMIGGEVAETYLASSSAATKTRTVTFPLGVISNGLSANTFSKTVQVYFPENGSSTSTVSVKKAWFRVIGNNYASGGPYTMALAYKLNSSAASATSTYNYDPGARATKPSFNVIHTMDGTATATLSAANADNPVDVTLYEKASNGTPGGASAELVVTYTYTSDTNGYLSNISLFGGQSTTNSNTQSTTTLTANAVIPDTFGTKAILAGGLLASYLFTDSGGNMANANLTLDANLSSGTPTCTNAYNARMDSINGFAEFYKDVRSALYTTNNLSYRACYSNNGAGQGTEGAKMNGQLIYTYKVGNVAPTGTFNSAAQKTDGTGAVDISFVANDGDQQDLKAKLEYESGSACAFAAPSKAAMDTVDANTSATYGDPKIDNPFAYQIGTTTGWIITSSGANTVNTDWNSKADLPDVDNTYCLRLTVNDSIIDQTVSATTTVNVDNLSPTAPGVMSTSSLGAVVRLTFGSASTENHFDQYRIFYKMATTSPAESDTEHIDPNLSSRTYNGALFTDVTQLKNNTTYTFNIWAYDTSGNRTSSTPVTITTGSGRANSVVFTGGSYSGNGTTGQQTDTENTFASFNFSLPEEGVSIDHAYIIFESQFEAYTNLAGNYTGYSLAFDACSGSCSPNAFAGSDNVVKNDNTVLAYAGALSHQVRLLLDVTREAQLARYSGRGQQMTAQIGYNLKRGTAANSIASARAQMILTYTYATSSASIANTAVYPLESQDSAYMGSKATSTNFTCVLNSTCPLFRYNFAVPEYATSPSAARLSQWFEYINANDNNGVNDITANVNIQGNDTDSASLVHESALNNSQSFMMRWSYANVGGYAENTSQLAEYRANSSVGAYYLIGGEAWETYTASSSAPVKTRTISFPLGVINNGLTNAETAAWTNVYFPENGNGNDNDRVTIKKAWFRLISNNYNTGANTISVKTKVGDRATSSAQTYNYDAGASTPRPSFAYIHIIPEADYAELGQANSDNAKQVSVATQNSNNTSQGGTSGELLVTYSYTPEDNEGYLSSLRMMGGQSEVNGNALSTTSAITELVLPEASTTQTILAGGLLSSYLISDSDGVVSANFMLGSNLSSGVPVCANSFYSYADAINSFTQFYRNVTSALSTVQHQSYSICVSNNSGTDADNTGGAKMNTQLVYTYKVFNPRALSVTMPSQYKNNDITLIPNTDWTNESQVRLFARATGTGSNIDFYFQVLDTDGTYATSSRTAPAATCSSGTAFNDCSGKIWKGTSSTTLAGWYSSAWLYRKKLTINASQVQGTQNNFPVLASTTDSSLAYTAYGGNVASSTGGDIIITDTNGTTLLNFERESYDPQTGSLRLWIKTDVSSAQDKILYLYYGNSAPALGNLATTTGVWDSNYLTVQHLTDLTTASVRDSSAGNFTGTKSGANNPLETSSLINKGQQFSSDTISYGNFGTPTSYTAEAWIRPGDVSVGTGDYSTYGRTVMASAATGSGYPLWMATRGTEIRHWAYTNNSTGYYSTTGANLTTTDFYHVAVTATLSGTARIYLNGVEMASSTASNNAWTNIFTLGDLRPTRLIYFDGLIDEVRVSNNVRSAQWIATEYNNQDSPSSFMTVGGEESQNIEIRMTVPVPDSADGYKWQAMICNENAQCSWWDKFDTTIPNFRVDATPPIAPGSLTLHSKTSRSVTLNFGTQASENNFLDYRVYYQANVSTVSEADNLHSSSTDENLGYLDYNGRTNTTISGLIPNTQYAFNIWAYDQAGNRASATPYVVSTAEAGRARTVQFVAGAYSGNGTTGQSSDTDQTFSSFNFALPDSGLHIENAFILFESQFEAYSDGGVAYSGYNLAFDACQQPCTPNAFSGSGRVLKDDNTVLAYREGSLGGNQVRLLLDVTNETQLAAYTGTNQLAAQVGYRLERGAAANSIANAKAALYITYTADKNSPSLTNTVWYPLEHYGSSGSKATSSADDCTLNSNCPLFEFKMDVPEYSVSPSASRLSQWFQTYNLNDNNGTNDVNVNVNIQGNDNNSDTFIYEVNTQNDRGNTPAMVFAGVPGFSENTTQALEYHATSAGAPSYYLIGGEVAETYTASTSALTKTRTAVFPLGVLKNGFSATSSLAAANIYFPENGSGAGAVTVKKAWFRIVSNNYNTSAANNSITVASKTGTRATTTSSVYYYNMGALVINPSFRIVHIIPSADYSELALANATDPKTVTLSALSSNSTEQGGLAAELLITYSYSSESSGYLSSLAIYGGQTDEDPSAALSTTSLIYSVMPETDTTKTLLAAGLWSDFLISDSDGDVGGTRLYSYIDVNISTDTPACTNSFIATNDSTNSFIEYFKNVTSALNIYNNQAYGICFSNDRAGDINTGGAKSGAVLEYVYQYYDPPSILVDADHQYKQDAFTDIANGAWTTENEVNLHAVSSDTSTSTQVNFYFELLDNSSAFRTIASAPTSTCANGTSFAGCPGKVWTLSASTTSAWYNTSWTYRKKLTINASQISAGQTNFPVLATTTDSALSYVSYGGHMGSSTGADILITDSDMLTPLNFEREYYASTTGQVALWVKTDISSTTNKILYLYYGNADASDNSTTTGVWDSDYLAVWHLNNQGTVVPDSVGINNGTVNGTVSVNNSGGMGYGQDFVEAESDYLDMGRVASYEGQQNVTFEAYFKTDGTSNDDMIFAKGGAGVYYPLIWRDESTMGPPVKTDSLAVAVTGATNRLEFTTNTFNNTNWHYLAIVFDGANQQLRGYLDGTEDSASPIASGLSAFPASTANLWLGRWQGSGYPLDGQISEARISKVRRSAQWISTQANNWRNASSFISFDSTEDSFSSSNIEALANITALPDSANGYKWQVLACNNGGACTTWNTFDAPPNFKVDATLPTAPGNLTLSTSTATTLTIQFGSASLDDNFKEYKIFYKEGVSDVDEQDTQLNDADLQYIDYNGASTTQISGLQPVSQYVVNIWAYDLAGNRTKAVELIASTTEAAHSRVRTVSFPAGTYSGNGTTGQNSNTDQTFSVFNFRLGEKEVSIRDAYIVFESQFEGYADNAGNYTGYSLSFDSCQEPCTADALAGTGRAEISDATVLAYNETDSNIARLILDVTDEVQLAAYSGELRNMQAQVGYKISRSAAVNSIASAKATLHITYTYNGDISTSYTNTVIYPLESSAAGDSGTRRARQTDDCALNSTCPTFNYNFSVPDAKYSVANWFQAYLNNDLNLAVDIRANVNIQGTDIDSDTYIHEAFNANEQSNPPMMLFNSVPGFATNSAQVLEYHPYNPSGAGSYDLMGGEAYSTYIASTSAPTKTRTAAFPIGVINNGANTNTASATAQVYFPENGGGSGIVTIKKAWFRIISNDRVSANDNITVSSKVGSNSQSGNYIYNFNSGGDVVKPSFVIVHVVPSADYSELGAANASTPKAVTVYTTNSSAANIGGASAELMITYSYTSEATGYLSTVSLNAGQSMSDGNASSDIIATSNSVFPELNGTMDLRAAGLLSSYLMSDSDAGMPAAWFRVDANLSTGTPICANAHYMQADGRNTFTEMYKNVLSAMDTIDDQSFSACYSSDAGGDADNTAGAKMNGILTYTYQWNATPPMITQNDWRWYVNADNVQPTTAKAAANTSVGNINLGDILRLRVNLGITKENLAANTQAFKLQYGIGSDCAAISAWSDVDPAGGSGIWLGYNNPEPTDGASLSSYLLSTSNVAESYEESNPSASNHSALNIGDFGEWDWVLYNNNATSSSDYCFRMVKSDGSAFDDYLSDSYPRLTTAPANTAPSDPGNISQLASTTGAVIANGAWINYNSVKLSGSALDPNLNETIIMYFQLIPNTNTPITATTVPANPCNVNTAYTACTSKVWAATSTPGDYRTNPYFATTSIGSIPENASGYRWQILACDDSRECAPDWQTFGANPNFRVDMTPPTVPGKLVFYGAEPTNIIMTLGASSVESNFNRYRIFYKTGTSGVTEANTEHNDANLLFINYNSATSTKITNLSAGTQYVFNIWAYDLAGNKATSSGETLGTTTSSYTPPSGIFVSAAQKTNGSGVIDITIQADDPDNDDTLRAKLEYEAGMSCAFSTAAKSYIDPTDANTAASYGDPKIDNDSVYQIGSSTGWIMTSPGPNFVSFDWMTLNNIIGANGTYCMRLITNDGLFNSATATQLVYIDTLAPTAPGQLTPISKTDRSITFSFGSQSSDTNFNRYRIYYREGTSTVSELDTEFSDPHLLSVNYGAAATTTITGLHQNLDYAFNIWAYDNYGNTSSSTFITTRTNAQPLNLAASNQYKSDQITIITNGAFTNEDTVAFKAAAHDQDIGDLVTFYYQAITSTSTYLTATSVPPSACVSGDSFAACSGKVWSIATTSYELAADWYDKDWPFRKEIRIFASQVPADQSSFPILVATSSDSDLSFSAREDAHDILFTAADGLTLLAYEREYYSSSTGQFIGWVKSDISSTTDTSIYMYYGNRNYSPDIASNTAPWDLNYKDVWHLGENVVDESNQSDAHIDSTASGIYGYQHGNNEVTGKIYRGQEFDGINDYISIGNTGSSINTVSFWIKPYAATDEIMDMDGGAHTITLASSRVVASGFASPVYYVNGVATSSIAINEWQYVTVTTGSAINANNLNLGRIGSGYFSGILDEVRLSSSVRSANWISTQYRNQNQSAGFSSYGSESRVTSYYEIAMVTSVPDSMAGSGYKWQVLACDDDGICANNWAKFNVSIPNFKVDTIAPTAPGSLYLNAKAANRVTLNFGGASSDTNFSHYKIFYSSSSPVTEASMEKTDSNLDYIDYNGASTVTINGLQPDTAYYFNIWAYDQIGNRTSSSPLSVTTSQVTSAPGAVFYTKNDRTLYYRRWDGSNWGTEKSGPTLGSGVGQNIRHVAAMRSDDGGKIAVLAQTWSNNHQEWWATVYRYTADDFISTTSASSTQLGGNYLSNTYAGLLTGCLAYLSGGQFMVVRTNNGANGTLIYTWSQSSGWVTQAAGPNIGAVMSGCKLIRRPETDNYLLMTFDNAEDTNTAYYWGGDTYANIWSIVTEHSVEAQNNDTTNFVGDAVFSATDNTAGVYNYVNIDTATNTIIKKFQAGASSLNFGSTAASPYVWTGSWVHGEFAANPAGGSAYYAGRDNSNILSVIKVDLAPSTPVWSSPVGGTNLSAGYLYPRNNYSQKPFALVFYRDDYAVVGYNNTNAAAATTTKYRVIDATNDTVGSEIEVPGSNIAVNNYLTRVNFFKDPNEQEFLGLYQIGSSTANNVQYAGVFWDGVDEKFYNSTDHPGSNQKWTSFATGIAVTDRDDSGAAFAYSNYNSAPNSLSPLEQLKSDASSTIANGDWTNESQIRFKVTAKDADTNEAVAVFLQFIPIASTSATSTAEPSAYCGITSDYTACSGKIWLLAASSTLGDYSSIGFTASGTISGIPDSASGYKWQAIACDDDHACSGWTVFNAATPNVKVDATVPAPPGNLTIESLTSNSITLHFGGTATDDNFRYYKIFYKQALSGATETDIPHPDSNLNFINYNNAANTTVLGLASNTPYVFNIWVYDWAGNKATATPEIATTTSSGPTINQRSFIWEDDDGADVNSNTAAAAIGTAFSNAYKGERLNARIQIDNSGGDSMADKAYKLQFENQTDNPGVWQDVGAATAISYALGLSGSNADDITSSKAAANARTWVYGKWQENTNTTAAYTLNKNSYTELAFAVHTGNATIGKTYRLRLYNSTDSQVLDNYIAGSYPVISIASSPARIFSKQSNSSLPSTNANLAYYLDPKGYADVAADDNVRDPISASSNYPISQFIIATTTNTYAMSVAWNGQSSIAASSRPIFLQVFRYGSPDQWVTVATNTTANANTDFNITATINSSLSSYYDGSNRTYWRIYQDSGTETVSTDYFNIDFITPMPSVVQNHYRWRNNNGTEATASWREVEDTGDPYGATTAINKGDVIRLRISVADIAAGAANNYAYKIEYATNTTGSCSDSSSWNALPAAASAHWQMATSSYVGNGSTTVQRFVNAEGYSYSAGVIIANPSSTSSAISLAENGYTELEYVIKATDNAETAGTYCFRLTNNGSLLNSYSQYPIITLAGNTNPTPYFTIVASDNGSASTSPTNYGESVSFTGTASTSDEGDYYLAVCKSNSIAAGNDAPPSCTSGSWCVSAAASSTQEASCSYNAADSAESLDWFAFVCDKHPGFSIAKCSTSSQGILGTVNGSPFVINHPPVLSSVSTTDNNKDPGSIFTITTVSSDTDTVNGNDTLSLYVCYSNSASIAGCAGGVSDTVCSAVATSSPNAKCYYSDTAPTPPGSNTYYAFIYDNHGVPATGNSKTNSYTINNTPTSLGTLVLNGSADITLNIKGAGDKAVSAVMSSLTDLNGCQSLIGATAVEYMSNASGGYNCAANDNSCYQIGTGNCVLSNCDNANDMIATYTCTSNFKYYAIPTDDSSGNPNEQYNWLSYIIVNDGLNYTATTSAGVELITNTALDVSEETIDFGSNLFVGDNTGTDNETTSIYNSGNSPIKNNIFGTDMSGGSSVIAVNYIKWKDLPFDYSIGNSLTNVAMDSGLILPKASSTTEVSRSLYWGIGIPFGVEPTAYTGTNSFSATLDNSNW